MTAPKPKPGEPYVYQEFPKWIDGPSGAVIVHNREAEEWQTAMRRRRRWRREWIAKFAERQRTVRRWIAVVDLIDWCAHSTRTASIEAEAQARELAYRSVTESVQRGEFERDGRSKLLYLDALVTSDGASSRCRLIRVQFEIAVDAAAAPP